MDALAQLGSAGAETRRTRALLRDQAQQPGLEGDVAGDAIHAGKAQARPLDRQRVIQLCGDGWMEPQACG